MFQFLKMGLKKCGSPPKTAQKQRFLTFLGPWNPSADRFFDQKRGRGGVPALFLAVFSLKTGLEPLRKRDFCVFGAFLRGFGAVLGRFWTVLGSFLRVFGPRPGPGRTRPDPVLDPFLMIFDHF